MGQGIPVKIGTREIGPYQPCYIIAEAGTAYMGDAFKAKEYALAAFHAGADAVKFQVFIPDEPLFCPLPGDERRWERWSKCAEMPYGDWRYVKEECCDPEPITFLASAFQPTAVQWLKELGVSAYKVASRAAATYPYDAAPGPFIISDGMGWGWHKRRPYIRLQCVSKYPTPLSEAAWLRPMTIGGPPPLVGLSDHSGTIWPGLNAMARGCPMLECHFCIDRADAGPDAAVCLTVDELKLLCEARDAFWEMRKC